MNTENDIFLVPIKTVSFPFELPLRRNGFFLIHPVSIQEYAAKCEADGKDFNVELKRKGIKAQVMRTGYTRLSIINI